MDVEGFDYNRGLEQRKKMADDAKERLYLLKKPYKTKSGF